MVKKISQEDLEKRIGFWQKNLNETDRIFGRNYLDNLAHSGYNIKKFKERFSLIRYFALIQNSNYKKS